MKRNDIPSVLIIEDDMDLQFVYSMILRSQGYRVDVASDGMDGLLKLKNYVPNLILLDYFMPRMDGKSFLQNYDSKNFPNTKIVVTSNVSDKQILNELKQLGAYRTVLKADLSPSELLSLVEDCLH